MTVPTGAPQRPEPYRKFEREVPQRYRDAGSGVLVHGGAPHDDFPDGTPVPAREDGGRVVVDVPAPRVAGPVVVDLDLR